ncbi:MAG: DUF3301 domain-containing protein [Gammaproteobacteria bacterium]|nr:DUF3301 domain-containing protein [Gammaproteobacteria bacterium]
MLANLLPLLVLGILALLWLDAARARELATALVQRHCERTGLQFLDETVALARMGVRWTSQGLKLRRMYRFEFSLEGVGRQIGYILMLGMNLETIDDGLPFEDEAAPEKAPDSADKPSDPDRKVIPFRRRDN